MEAWVAQDTGQAARHPGMDLAAGRLLGSWLRAARGVDKELPLKGWKEGLTHPTSMSWVWLLWATLPTPGTTRLLNHI